MSQDIQEKINSLALQTIQHRGSSSSEFIRKLLWSFGSPVFINLQKFAHLDDTNTERVLEVVDFLSRQFGSASDIAYWMDTDYYRFLSGENHLWVLENKLEDTEEGCAEYMNLEDMINDTKDQLCVIREKILT